MGKHDKLVSEYIRATELVLAITFTALTDTFGKDIEYLNALWAQMNKLSDEISEGRVNVKDMSKTLLKESGINITGGFKK